VAVASTLALTVSIGLSGPPSATAAPEIVAAGDIACPGSPCEPQRLTARLVSRIDPDAVLTLGDHQYERGALEDFRSSYDPTWGRFRSRTRPTPGNHEYLTPGAQGYFSYFGRRARLDGNDTYSFGLGRWHVVSINTGAGPIGSAQLRWVRRDLRRDGHACELAYWHHPRWSSGRGHGSDRSMAPLWRALVRAGVDVVLNGHEHSYERFAPMTARGRVAPLRGMREFVVGTGGASLHPMGRGIRGSQRRIDDAWGVLRLVLRPWTYGWRFKTVDGRALDRGSHRCHR
jgi:3',5'-cyclic AMP phosphodiesterase CpdA